MVHCQLLWPAPSAKTVQAASLPTPDAASARAARALPPPGAGSWYLLFRGFHRLARAEFQREWDAHPAELKRVRTGLERRWSQFLRRGGGAFRYARWPELLRVHSGALAGFVSRLCSQHATHSLQVQRPFADRGETSAPEFFLCVPFFFF